MPLIKCKTCEKEYSDVLNACFHCGEPNSLKLHIEQQLDESESLVSPNKLTSYRAKIKPENTWLKYVTFIFVCFMLYLIFKVSMYSYHNSVEQSQASNNLSVNNESGSQNSATNSILESDYDDPTIPLLNVTDIYRQAAVGDLRMGEKVVLIGSVGQILGNNKVRVWTKQLVLPGGYGSNIWELAMQAAAPPTFLGGDVIVAFNGKPKVIVGDYIGIKGVYDGVGQDNAILEDGAVGLVHANAHYYAVGGWGTPALNNFFSGRSNQKNKIAESKRQAEQDTSDKKEFQQDSIAQKKDVLANQPPEKTLSAEPVPLADSIPKEVEGVAYFEQPDVTYPESAAGATGTTVVRALINVNGTVDEVTVQRRSGNVQLDHAALQAVKRARFKPYRENGEAEAVYTLVPIAFVAPED